MNLTISNAELLSIYQSNLDRSIVSAVRGDVHTLWHLISILPGYYPTVVRDAVARLIGNSMIPPGIADEGSGNAIRSRSQLDVQGLPVPHPLDCDWRFTKGTADELLERLESLIGPNNSAALLGAPSVYVRAKNQRMENQLILLDRNETLANSSGLSPSWKGDLCCNLMHGAPNLPPVHAVLADPPWYVDEAVGFLRAASQICVCGATILLSYAPDGVRPGIPEERKRIIAEAKTFGINFSGIDHLTLSYATPFFEHNALRASAFRHIASDWRSGDLLSFRKSESLYLHQSTAREDENAWVEVSVEGVRFKVRQKDEKGFANPQLKKLVPGNVLPSVSRRDSRRHQVDIWTSGNRVYRCDGTHIMTVILHAIQASENPLSAVQHIMHDSMDDLQIRLVESSVLQVQQIVRTECREIKVFASVQ